ncbi:MAG TPA: UDP-3-O-acyl-N-acetylglucosamine deacetylase, partial [Opitutus sp.]|nr:UDP-3-O-acyl-N-acetylglucosamine deacetylase [Opitutus sp.]
MSRPAPGGLNTGVQGAFGSRHQPTATRAATSRLLFDARTYDTTRHAMKQRTLGREVSIKGNALHTGDAVTLTLKPAPVDHGVVFKRVDLHGAPELKPRVDQITDLVRATTIQVGHAKIHTVEHVLSALHGCGVDNVLVEMDASEPPIMDGSARPFVNLILQAEPVEQEKDREYFELDSAVSVTRGNSSIIALPS